MVDAINRISFRMTDWVMSPFESFSPWVGLVVFSFLTASVAVLAYKFCSDQSALRRRKSAAVGRLLEIRLYQEDLLGIFGTLRQLCGATGLYLAESLKPLAMLLVPVLLLLFQLSCWYQSRPLELQENALVKIRFDGGSSIDLAEWELLTSKGIVIETEPFQSRDGREVLWRIRGRHPDPAGWVELKGIQEVLRKSVSVAPDSLVPISQRRLRDGFFSRLMYPKEPRIPASSVVQSIHLSYGNASLYLGTHEVNWMIALFVLSIVIGLALQKPFRVEF